ncbi:LamB/YcsF family protein [Aquipuribacter nitratireducens]|uniref:LamB/YcsF family protein n=1 Tax=Aquipuribacter nitratireducens TaxID=650104 RepID=A0ABW0GPF7_9MICO
MGPVDAPTIDLNADLGEGFGAWRLTDDDALLDVVTSANVACGFHAGDASTMRRVCAAAAARGVVVGAQVSYRDLAGFGRRFIDADPAELLDEVVYQVAALAGLAAAEGTSVRYVKPHGALYNALVHHEAQARAVVAAVRDAAAVTGTPLPVLGLPGSVVERLAAEGGVPFVAEAFTDRAYTPQATLVPRREPGAVLDDPAEVAARAVALATDETVTTREGGTVTVRARSLCLHGDTPGAVATGRAVRAALEAAGVTLAPFA